MTKLFVFHLNEDGCWQNYSYSIQTKMAAGKIICISFEQKHISVKHSSLYRNITTSASCSIAPDSRRSESIGLWSCLASTARESWESAMIGTSNSLAKTLSAREISEISCCLDSFRLDSLPLIS